MSILGTELHPEAEEIISKKFNVLLSMNCMSIDTNLPYLEELLTNIKKNNILHQIEFY